MMGDETKKRPALLPFTTALWAGLTWAVLYAFVDNLPLLTQGDIVSHVRVRVQAAAYTTALYALTFSILMGMGGLLLSALLAATRRRAGRPFLLGLWFALLAGGTSFAAWLQSYKVLDIPQGNRNRPLALLLCALAALLVGAFAGALAAIAVRWWENGPARRSSLRRAAGRWGLPSIAAAAVLLLLIVGLYRNILRPALVRPSGAPATAERPNILLITVDTLRADHLGTYGYDPSISPHIDALARRGIYFQNASAQSSWTLPSVASMLTGMYPTELDIYSWRGLRMQPRLDPLRTTLAELLQSGGYRTQAYLTNAWLTVENSFEQGFANFVGFREAEPFDLQELRWRPLVGLAWRSTFLRRAIQGSHELLFAPRLTTANDSRYVSRYGVDFLREHRGERFFLWLYYMEPHTTYAPSQPFPSLPAGVSASQLNTLQTLDFWDLVDNGALLVPAEQRAALVSLYDGEIHDVDAALGLVLDELERLGLADRTLVVLHSDHGEEFLDHGGYGHGTTMYDELLRVPLIVAGPGIVNPGRTVAEPVQLLDVLPTLLEAAGVTPPPESHGRSLWPLLRGAELAEVPIYSEMIHSSPNELKAVRYQGWKLIYHFATDEVELYDLRADPGEQVNLAGQDPARAEEYLRLLRRWLAQAVAVEEALPRSETPAGVDERIRNMLREGGY